MGSAQVKPGPEEVEVKQFLMKWWAFFHPADGWENRLRQMKSGNHTWEVPGRPELPKLVPFPLAWIPHRTDLTEEDSEAAHARGFEFLTDTCVDTGLVCEPGVVVSCLRCGVSLHPQAASMYGGFDPPCCNRCRLVVKLLF